MVAFGLILFGCLCVVAFPVLYMSGGPRCN